MPPPSHSYSYSVSYLLCMAFLMLLLVACVGMALAVVLDREGPCARMIGLDTEPEVVMVHQIWFDFGDGRSDTRWRRVLPAVETVRAACSASPRVMYKLWTEEEADVLVRTCVPELYMVYSSMPKKIYQVDILRFVLVKVFGGLYLDTDIICQCDIAAFCARLFRNGKVAIPVINETSGEVGSDLLYSPVPQAPFWNAVLDRILALPCTGTAGAALPPPNVATGPVMLEQVLRQAATPCTVALLPPEVTKPFHYTGTRPPVCDMSHPDFDVHKCADAFPHSPFISLYQASWV